VSRENERRKRACPYCPPGRRHVQEAEVYMLDSRWGCNVQSEALGARAKAQRPAPREGEGRIG